MTRHPLPNLSFALVTFTVLAGTAAAQEGLKSGPQKGEFLPGVFHAYNLNGKFGIQRNEKGELVKEGQYHCLVCEYGLQPVVLILAREPKVGRESPLMQLLKRVDEAIGKDQNSSLRGFVVFLSPDASSSVTEAGLAEDKRTKDPDKLVAEAVKRQELTERLEKLAAPLKNLVATYYPEAGPPKYNLSDKADVTVILYHKYKVLANHAFGEGQLTEQQIDPIMQGINELSGHGKKEKEEKEGG
jgi:hypothetical protein